MPVQLSIHAVIEGANVADAKAQLVSLFGVALGRVAVVDEPDAPPALNGNGGEPAPVPVILEGQGRELQPSPPSTGQLEQPQRRRRTKAEMAAAQAGAAIENAPQPETKPVNGAAEELDLLSGGHGSDDDGDVDPFAEDPPKPLVAATPTTLSKDDMMGKGREVLNKHGMQKLTDILSKHGFKRIAELPEHAYPAVWADLAETLA